MEIKTRKSWRRRGVTLGVGFALTVFYIASVNTININPSAYYNASEGLVLVKVDLANATALLQIPCNVDSKSMMNIDYTSPLVDVIPRYSFNITIQTPAECQGGKERSKGIEKIKSFLQYMFPLSDADHVVVPPGSLSLSIDASGQSEMPNNSDNSLFTTQVPLVEEGKGHQSLHTRKCNNIRGRLGKWIYNSTYGGKSWYIPANGQPGGWLRNNELSNGPFNHTSWMWKSDQSGSCQVELLTFRGFCEAMHALNTTRIMHLGDSIEYMRTVSFIQMLGFDSQVHLDLKQSSGIWRYAYRFDCPSVGSSFPPVDLVFHRINHLMPIVGNSTRYLEHEFHHFICYDKLKRVHPDENGWCPWVKEYIGNPERTLIVGGVGPHFHQLSTFEEHLQNLYNLLKQYPRPNDIILLRTVLPGHENCQDALADPIDPLSNYQEFREIYSNGKDADRWYGWNLHEVYNQRYEAEVIKIKRDKNWIGSRVELLDIYWMTALRRDGHPSPIDCLHYLLPGPPDWWNHLLYSNLKELANL